MAALAVATLITACASGSGGPSVPGPAKHTYEGPLYVAHLSGAHPKAGAAGQVVDCTTWGDGGSVTRVPYYDGATTDRPEQALHEEGIFFGGAQEGLRVAKEVTDRVLYVLEVNGVVKEAVIVHDGPAAPGAGGPGWYVESWAVCDNSELPRWYTDSIGQQIWTDSSGHPVPTEKIESWRGPEHCDWQSMTFLYLGKASYVRNPEPDLGEYFADPYRAHGQLPKDAIDTGYERGGQKLWLSADVQVAYVGTATDVETWPREVKPLLCA
jgi:hypothetical protein